MTRYQALQNLSPELLAKFLDQVFLTGFNAGYQSLVDPEINDEHPFDDVWLNAEVGDPPMLIEDEDGEPYFIEPLADVIRRIAEFDFASIPDDIHWTPLIILPKELDDDSQNDEEQNHKTK